MRRQISEANGPTLNGREASPEPGRRATAALRPAINQRVLTAPQAAASPLSLLSQGYTPKEFFLFVRAAQELEEESVVGFLNTVVTVFDYETFTDVMRHPERREYLAHIIKQYREQGRQEAAGKK